jgi:hypothetical protein
MYVWHLSESSEACVSDENPLVLSLIAPAIASFARHPAEIGYVYAITALYRL